MSRPRWVSEKKTTRMPSTRTSDRGGRILRRRRISGHTLAPVRHARREIGEDERVKLTDVQFKVVADINKKGEGAKVVQNAPTGDVRPRVDSKLEVETGGAKPIGDKAT